MLLEQCSHQEGFQNNHYFQDSTLTLNDRYPCCLIFYQRLFYIHVSTTISPTITTPLLTLYSFTSLQSFSNLFSLFHDCKSNPKPSFPLHQSLYHESTRSKRSSVPSRTP